MAQNQNTAVNAKEIDRLASQLAKDPHSKVFMPLADEYGKAGMWQEAAVVLEDGLKLYPGFITAMVALGRAYDHMGEAMKAQAILEESVKLSPENLRAHRTLIKIYQSQGLNESALQSCAAILATNPRDEEALSVQSSLGGPLKHKKEPERPKPAAPVTLNLSAQQAAAPPAPVESKVSAPKTSTAPDLPVSTPAERPRGSPAGAEQPEIVQGLSGAAAGSGRASRLEPRATAAGPFGGREASPEPEIASTDPRIVVPEPMETALHTEDQIGEQRAVPKPDPQAADTVLVPTPSPHAEVVAQLETWLRTIESRRLDRDTTNESQPKTS
jgi:tetratricopeptide (TPR) repeat protein